MPLSPLGAGVQGKPRERRTQSTFGHHLLPDATVHSEDQLRAHCTGPVASTRRTRVVIRTVTRGDGEVGRCQASMTRTAPRNKVRDRWPAISGVTSRPARLELAKAGQRCRSVQGVRGRIGRGQTLQLLGKERRGYESKCN